MTEILTANVGSYPRIGEEKDHQRHRRALTHLQNREISSHAFHDVEQSVLQEVTKEQIEAGLDEVTDGQVSWHDPISHFSRKCKGIHFQSLARYLRTNSYYRIPVFTGKPSRKAPATINDFKFTQGISNKPVRAILTGPVTLALYSQSEISKFNKFQSRLSFYRDLIGAEITALLQEGATIIQIDEPGLVQAPEHLPVFKQTIQEIISTTHPNNLILNLAHGPLSSLYLQIKDLPIHGLNLDFTYDGKKCLENLITNPPSFPIGLGLVNGQNTRLDPIDAHLTTIRTFIDKTSPKKVYVTPSCGLDFLPRPYAFKKCQLLVKIKGEVYA